MPKKLACNCLKAVHGIDEDFVSIHNLLHFVSYGYDGDTPAGNFARTQLTTFFVVVVESS